MVETSGNPSGNNLWRKNLYVLWAAQLIAMTGMSACVPFLPLFVRQLGVTDLQEAQHWSGLVFAGPFVLSFLATPIWGVLGDRYGRKPMVVSAIIGLTIAMFLMGFAHNVWELFLLRVFQGAVSGFIAACLSLVSSSTPPKHSGFAIGFLQSSISSGQIFGPLVGGVLSDAFGVRSVFWIVGTLCLISAIVVMAFVEEKFIPPEKNTKKESVWSNLQFIFGNPHLRRIVIFIILTQSGMVFTGPIFAYFVETLGAPQEYLATITGMLIGSVGLLTTIFAPIWGKRNDLQTYEKTMLLTIPFIAGATIIQGIVPSYQWLFPLRIIIGIFAGAMVPTLYTALSKRSPESIRGGIMGLASSATLFANLCSPIACGWVAAHFGMRWSFLLGGSFLLSVFATLKIRPESQLD